MKNLKLSNKNRSAGFSAKLYHTKIIESFNNSKFRPHSLLYLSEIEPKGNWGIILEKEYPDSSYISDSTKHHTIYLAEIKQDDFIKNKEIYFLITFDSNI